MHPLLKRQISKLLGGGGGIPPEFDEFFQAVSDAYTQSDGDRELIERSLELMSTELTERNRQMRQELEVRRKIEQELLREKAEQQELIRRLEEAHNQLLQSEKMASVGQLAAGIAHEINNPIGFVSSNLFTLEKYIRTLLKVLETDGCAIDELSSESPGRQLAAEVRKASDMEFLQNDIVDLLHESNDGLKRVKQIVIDLKDFSHADTGTWAWSNLHQGIDTTLNMINNKIKYKAEVIKEYGDIPQIRCNISQLNQVFMNLLVNAAHAIETRGTITIRTGSDSEQVWVEIEDTGSGIEESKQNRIFDPFFTTKPVGQGTGLGLSIAYGIIEKHRGHIHCHSEPGKGTRFRVVLPIDNEQ